MANIIEQFLAMLSNSQMQGAPNRLAAAGQAPQEPNGGILAQLLGGGGSNDLLGGPGGDRLTDTATARVDQAFNTVASGPDGDRLLPAPIPERFGGLPQQLAQIFSPGMGANLPMIGGQASPASAGNRPPPQADPTQTASVAAARGFPAGDPYLAWQRGLGSDGGSMPAARGPLQGHSGQNNLVGGSGADISLGGNATGASGPPANNSGGDRGGFGGFLSDLFADPQAKAKTETVTWLMKQGVDQGSATYLANNRNALRSYLNDHVKGSRPDWQMQTIYDAKGNEQRVLMDMNNPGSIRPLGGAKTNLKTPEEIAQAKEIAAAGKTDIKLPTLENEYDKTLGKSYGDRFTEIQKEAQTAQRAMNSLAVMEQVMGNEGFYSGAAAEQVKRVKQFGAALGFDASGVQDMETFIAMSKQAALDVMGGSLGTGFSNADRDFVIDQVPNIGNTLPGNAQLIGIQRKLAQRKQQIAQLARDYAKNNGGRIDPGFDGYLAQWAEANPLFPPLPAKPGNETGPERVRNPQPGPGRPRASNAQGEVIEFDGTQWVPAQ